MVKFLKIFLFACVVVLPCAALLTEIVLYSQNSLYLNDRWIVQKRMMKMGLIRADEFLLTRTPLARNLLNLGSYNGYQEVTYRQRLTPGQIAFQFQVEDGSYLDLTYNRDGAGYSGLRLSRVKDMPSIVFESTEEGRFRSKNSLPIRVIGSGWHNASIRSSSSGLILTIDQQASPMPTAARFAAGVVGFRAGMNGARIDDVVIEQRTGPSLRESFRNSKNWPRTFACNVGLLVLFGALLSRITLGRFWVVTKEGFFYWTMFSMVGFLCAGCWHAVDFFLYSKRVPRGLAITRPLNSEEGFTIPSFERLRFLAFEAWYGLAGGETITHQGVADRGYPDRRIYQGPIYCGPAKEACVEGMPPKTGAATSGNAQAYRVLLIGSSQTAGAGARDLQETFFVRVHDYLREAVAPKFRLESLNLAVSGYRAADLVKEYKARYRDFQPDLMVINLSFNDRSSPEKFAAAMTEFLDFNRTAGIKTILLEEANSAETARPKGLAANHQVLRQLGQKYGVPVLPLDNFLTESAKQTNGTLWWDQAHLTSYGQEVTAAWLAPQLLDMLRTARGKAPFNAPG